MRSTHPVFWILLVCLVSVLLLGFWILRREAPSDVPRQPPTPRPASPTPQPRPRQAQGATSQADTGHRLAGTVVGDAQYAIVEDPGGGSELYHLGDEVSDLGEVTRIEPDRVVFQGSNGLVELRLAPAPTGTPAPVTPTFPIGITTELDELPLSDPTP